MSDKLDFERILALSYKAAKYIEFKYGADSTLCEEKALDIWSLNKDHIEILADYSNNSKEYSEKQIYFLFKDKIRIELGIKQVRNDGKLVWVSPFHNLEIYDDTVDEIYAMESFDVDVQKEIFYQHRDAFMLTKNEALFIDLIFAGYNPTNTIDVLVFKEALNTDSTGYVKTFFNRLCKKLEEKSKELGLR